MDELRIYTTGIIFSVLAAGIAFMLLPKKSLANPVRLAAAAAVLIALLTPLFKLSDNYRDIVSSADADLPSGYVELEDVQRVQTTQLARERFSESVNDILLKNGITPQLVHIYVSAEGDDIRITDIAVTLSETTTASEKLKTENVITEVFGIQPSITISR